MRCRRHGERWRERWSQKSGPSCPGKRGHWERRERLRVDPVPCWAAGTWVSCRVSWASVHAEKGFVGQARMDDAPVSTPSTTGPPSPTHTSLSPLLVGCRVALLDLRVDGGAIAAVAHRPARHSASHRAEHAAGAAQVVVRREDFRRGRGGKAEVSPRTSGDRRGALRNAAAWRHQG